MKIENFGVRKLGLLVTSHDGQSIEWNASNYDQPNLSEPDGLFRDINGYWESLPKSRQDVIFGCYVKIKEYLDTIADTNRLIEKVKAEVKILYEYQPYDEFRYWIDNKANLVKPHTLRDEYSSEHPAEMTYLRKHYNDLMIFALQLRPMVPIWAEFIRVIKVNTSFNRERLSVRLLGLTNILESEPATMLRTHVELLKNKDSDKHKMPLSALVDSIGSEDLGEWLYCLVVVRRAALGELSKTDTNVNIISNIYKHVANQLGQLDRNRRFGGRISEKHNDRDSGEGEDNVSRAESYKAKEEITAGTIIDITIYLEDNHRVAKQIDETVDIELLERCLRHGFQAFKNGTFTLSQHQVLMTQWVLNKVVPARVLEYPDAEVLIGPLAVTQALLWHWGLPELAVLMFVKEGQREFGSTLAKSRVSKENTALLHQTHPYYRQTQGSERQRSDCVALTTIDRYSDLLGYSGWWPTGPAELIEAAKPLRTADGAIIIPSDIKNSLARFIIKNTEIAKIKRTVR